MSETTRLSLNYKWNQWSLLSQLRELTTLNMNVYEPPFTIYKKIIFKPFFVVVCVVWVERIKIESLRLFSLGRVHSGKSELWPT